MQVNGDKGASKAVFRAQYSYDKRAIKYTKLDVQKAARITFSI